MLFKRWQYYLSVGFVGACIGVIPCFERMASVNLMTGQGITESRNKGIIEKRKDLFKIKQNYLFIPLLSNQSQSVQYNPPNRGAPGQNSTIRNAGSRSCGVIAMVPTQTNWGETLDAQPTLWFYVSQPGRAAFALRSEQTNTLVYEQTLSIVRGDGIVSLPLPVGVSLTPNQIYRWSLTLDCPIQADETASGIIVRRRPSDVLQTKLKEGNSQEKIVILAANGFWHDALNLLANARLKTPQDETLRTYWVSLLRQPIVSLGDLVEVRLIGNYDAPANH